MTPLSSAENTKNRTQRAVSPDGTKIVAQFYGQGPPILLLPAGPGDSETSWHKVALSLSEQFTCYLLNTRGRGMSDDHPDHSSDRLVEDVLAYARSINEPAGIVGWGSDLWARVAARNPAELFAVAVYEPAADEVMNPEAGKRMGEIFAEVGEHVAAGRIDEAARTFIENCDVIYSEEDIDSGAAAEFWKAAAERLPLLLQESKQASGSGQSGATSPETLGKIQIPVLLMHGDRTSKWFSDSVKHVAGLLPDTTTNQIRNAAHFGPLTHPDEVAEEMIRFFTEIHKQSLSGADTG